ncbi:extracellular solute-binding protein [Breznakiella homolactica]|uniref:Extracellular solute-binding protein n=1 Tax=Breznakiella homolactica TaxID=2798577 RepID=A0A7T8B9S1_9SPIR|nr:extracellular solute-binding protein [Breznakiella homolactica]QQO08601.1 extracellular solute-binding protein [Breznakiella homolactica]
MATIKDIAQLAGVSQGTVSHVLNGKGNVSSEKIKLVQDAAAKLGYIINERAKILRQGKGRILAVVLPNIRFRQYEDFLISFKAFAENQGYTVTPYISNDDPDTERSIFNQIRSSMAAGAAVFSCLHLTAGDIRELGFSEWELLFAERDQPFPCNYIGFDFKAAGKALAAAAVEKKLTSLALLTGSLEFSNEKDFFDAFTAELKRNSSCTLHHIETNLFRRYQSAMQLMDIKKIQEIFSTNHGFARTVRDVYQTFFPAMQTTITTVLPLFTMPENIYHKYELNYRLMGKTAAQHLIENTEGKTTRRRTVLENTGFRQWYKGPSFSRTAAEKLHILTLESPTADAMKTLSRLFTQATGIAVHISIFSYDELHEVISSMGKSSIYDVIRLDSTMLPWFAPRILRPLRDIEPDLDMDEGKYIEGLSRQYFFVEDILYTLPVTPSTQMLFYRRDLFESTVLKRLYQEKYKTPLVPPRNFAEYNRIARFFTAGENPQSPVEFGSTLTLGSTGVAATEFLTRYFSYTDALFDDTGAPLVTGSAGIRAMKDLLEIQAYARIPCSSWWTDAAREFSDGGVAMTILYSNFASGIFGRSSRVINKVGYAVVPGGNPVLGGGALGVSKFSKYPKEALAYITWICDEPMSSARTLLGSVPPCRESFDNYEIIDAYPWLELSKECFSLSNYRRTPSRNNAPFDDRRFLSILGREIKNALAGVITAEEAMQNVADEYKSVARSLLHG